MDDTFLEKYDMVCLRWEDANADSTWTDGDAKANLSGCIEFGIVWDITDSAILLITGWNQHNALSSKTNIPRSNITDVVLIQPAADILDLFDAER